MLPPRPARATWAVPALLLLVFVAHRLAVALSTGDVLHPLEPSEAKHTQIAWDLATGRFGEEGRHLADYVTHRGAIHHGGYSSVALSYLLSSKLLGFDLLSVRATALLWTAAGVGVLLLTLHRLGGWLASGSAGLALVLAPTTLVGWQLSLVGAHTAAVLPLALAFAATTLAPATPRGRAAVGLALGYAVAFDYLLWPLALALALAWLAGSRPRGRAELLALGAGLLVGLWPLLLILSYHPGALGEPVLEDPGSTLGALLGRPWDPDLYLRTLRFNLPPAGQHFWTGRRLPAPWGYEPFEEHAMWALLGLPLALLPAALLAPAGALRRVAVALSVAPALTYVGIALAAPNKPVVAYRYLCALLTLASALPGLAMALGSSLARAGGARWLVGRAAQLATLAALAWMLPPRAMEVPSTWHPERAALTTQLRYVALYNLGATTLQAELAPELNDLLDLRAAQGEVWATEGLEYALHGTSRGLSLRDAGTPVLPWGWDELQIGLGEWTVDGAPLDLRPEVVAARAANVGWVAGIRSRWGTHHVWTIEGELAGSTAWPGPFDRAAFWRGYGAGLGRARPDLPAAPASFLDVPDEQAIAWIVEGMARGRALGPAPARRSPASFPTRRSPGT